MDGDEFYLDADRPATLRCGEHWVHCFTLQDAKLAWNRLRPEQRRTATIRVVDGALYQEADIGRLCHGRRTGQR